MSTNDFHAIYCGFTFGPTFGEGFDMYVASGLNSNHDSSSGFGYSYKHPDYQYGTEEAKSILAGSFNFQTVEIEVFIATN